MTLGAADFGLIQGLFYEEDSIGVFLLVTIVLGGGAAALAGRAIAMTWRPWWQVVTYTLILGGAVRFYYVVDSLICMTFGFAGFQAARAAQMVTQYPWINGPDGPLRWRRKGQ
jgi:hypothetical protein